MWAITRKATLLTVVCLLIGGGSAGAQSFRGRFGVGFGRPYYAPFFYDRFWGPYPYSSGVYPYSVRPETDLRVDVTPKQTEVYVDGFYAGIADDFDGVFQRLHTTPGGHVITLHLEGYRTITENIYAAPDNTYKLHDTMEQLAAGETSEAPPVPSRQLRGPRAPSAAPRSTRPQGD